jgi:putative FmdB family regulatory protein
VPTYDYECEACQHRFEAFHSMSAKPLRKCPECNKLALIKLIGAGAAAIIKGTTTPCKGEYRKPNLGSKLGEGENKSEAPWWRSGEDKKVRKDILKNPKKYIKTGEI